MENVAPSKFSHYPDNVRAEIYRRVRGRSSEAGGPWRMEDYRRIRTPASRPFSPAVSRRLLFRSRTRGSPRPAWETTSPTPLPRPSSTAAATPKVGPGDSGGTSAASAPALED